MPLKKDNLLKILIALLILVSVAFRIICIPHANYDMTAHNVPWYMTLLQNGIIKSMATEFANYSPPYAYFLALATFTHDFIPPLTAIKLIPMCFDVLGAFFIYKIVKLKYKMEACPFLLRRFFRSPQRYTQQRKLGTGRLALHLLFACMPVFSAARKAIDLHAVTRRGFFH